MPAIYLSKELYDAIIKSGKDPNSFVNDAVEAALAPKEDVVRVKVREVKDVSQKKD